MKQFFKTILISTICAFCCCACNVYRAQICAITLPNNVYYENIYIKNKGYEGMIFSEDYPGTKTLMPKAAKRFTPTLSQVDTVENILKKGIAAINSEKKNQHGENCPDIDYNLNKYNYLRQYFGYYADNGNRIIIVNCFWIDDKNIPDTWKTDEYTTTNECSKHWSVKVNLSKRTLFDLKINNE